MSTNLQNIQFSFRGDIVEDLTGGLLNQGITNTLGGNDVLQGKSPVDLTQLAQSPIAVLSYGIRNTATGQLWTIWGDDFLSGEGMIGIENAGFIFTGSGNDTITAEGIVALNNLGLINTESGNDTILTRDKGAGSYGSELTLGTIKSEGLGVGILRNSGSILGSAFM